MTGGSPGLDPCMVVVGDPCSEFVQAMVRLARESQVQTIRCEDVYSAVAIVARASGRRVFIAGAMRELAREEGRFFQIAEANGQRCCCFVRHDPAVGAGEMLAAVRSGACVVGDPKQVKPILRDWLAEGGPAQTDLADLMEDDLRATEAELVALLGRQSDE
ncbi:MAG: hypothetical protein ABFD90_02625 [Phycisphaerales bacterium]